MTDKVGDPCESEVLRRRLEECQRELAAVRTDRDLCRSHFDAARALARVGTFEYLVPDNSIRISDELCRILGMEPQVGPVPLERVLDCIHPDDRAGHERELANAVPGTTIEFEHRLLRRDGTSRWLWGRARVEGDGTGRPLWLRGMAQDITDFKLARLQVDRLNRKLRAVTACHRAVVRATDEDALLRDICRLVCVEAGYRMAWVGLAMQDERRTVRPVAWSGVEDDYLRQADITWGEGEQGAGPTGSAIRTGMTIFNQDFATNPIMRPWRLAALERGYRSSIALPLRSDQDSMLGCLTIYAGEPEAFTHEEIRLLEEMASNLAFGIVALRNRRERLLAEEEYRTLVDCIGDPLYVVDTRGRVLGVNRQACESLGYSREELLGLGMCDIDSSDDVCARIGDSLVGMRAGEVATFESRHRRKDGTCFPVEVRVATSHFEGQATFLATVRDLTARLGLERELLLKNRIAQVFLTAPRDATSDGLLALVLEVLSSPAGAFGYVVEGDLLVNVAFTPSLWEAGLGNVRPLLLTRADWGGTWGRALVHGLSQVADDPGGVAGGRMRVTRAMSVPVVYRGTVIGVFTVTDKAVPYDEQDRTDLESLARFVAPVLQARLDHRREEVARQHAEDERRLSEERFALVAEATHDGIWDWHREQDRSWYSLRYFTMLGYLPDEFPVHFGSWLDLIHPDDRPCMEEIIRQYHCRERDSHELECRLRGKDGAWRWVLARGRAVERDEQGSLVRVVGSHMDITERKVAEQVRQDLEMQLRQAQKMEALGQLAGGVAHDFNNLLVVIQGYTDLTLERLLPEDSRRAHLEQVKRAADRASHLTQQLLAFSRKEPGRMEPLDLATVAMEMEGMLRRLIPASLDLRVVTAAGRVLVEADRRQMEQVVMNLCINARDAMPDGGTLTVRVLESVPGLADQPPLAPAGVFDYVILEVSDTGQGIPPEMQAHVFEPFFTSKISGAGTGLGLATVYGIVQRHRGTIDFETVLGRGTTFRVYLPLIPDEGQEGSSIARVTSKRKGGHETILLAEDEPLVRDLTAGILSEAGYRVLAVRDGMEACETFDQDGHQVGLAVLDLVMPRRGGREVAEAIRRKNPTLPVIFCTGYSLDIPDERRRFRKTWVLRKPFDTARLLQVVREALDAP